MIFLIKMSENFQKMQMVALIKVLAYSMTMMLMLSDTHTPALYGTASIVPGLGQTLNGHYLEGVSWFVTSLVLISSKDVVIRNTGQDIWFYNIYDAWKDAGGKPSNDHFVGYEYAQNFNPANIADPFSIGYLGAAAASRSKAKNNKDNKNAKEDLDKVSTVGSIAMFTFVGLGEESLFRGFLYPSLSSWLGNSGGAVVSSAAFSFAHVGASSGGNAARFIMGMFFCWQYTRNNYQLGANVFAHSWYDQILIGNMSIRDPQNKKPKLRDPPLGIQFQISF